MKLQARFSLHRIKNIILLTSGLFLKACTRLYLRALSADGKSEKTYVEIFADLPYSARKRSCPARPQTGKV